MHWDEILKPYISYYYKIQQINDLSKRSCKCVLTYLKQMLWHP